jgi:hypothetical protein
VRVWIVNAASVDVNLQSFLGGDWVLSAEWGEDVDSPGMDATVMLARARDHLSLAPGRTASVANLAGTLLAPARAIWIEAAIVPTTRAVTSADWVEVFRGIVQAVDWGDPASITVSAVGLQGLLQAAWITTVGEYGSSGGTAVETVIQDVLNDWSPSPAPTLATPVSPGWMITPFQSQIQSVWDEIIQLSDSLGWNLRYLYNDGASEWQLTLSEPDRTSSATPYVLEPERWLSIGKAEDALDNVRNVVAITYGDSANLDATGQGTPTTYTATNAGSVTLYGSRWMGVTLDATSLIDTSAEATVMGDAILADVAYPKTAWSVVIPYFHAVELGDILTLPADGIWLDTAQNVSVVGYRHKLDTELRTTIQCRSAGAVAHHTSWLERAAQRGMAPLLQTSAPPSPTDFPPEIREVSGAVYVQGNTYWSGRKGGYQVEIHAGAVGFTPDLAINSATIVGRAKNAAVHVPSDTTRLPIGVSRDIVTYYLNDRGVRSAPYRITKIATRPGLGWVAQGVRMAGSFPGSTYGSVTRGASYPPDGWDMVTGTWNTAAKQDSGGTLTPPLTGTYALTLLTSAATQVVSEWTPVAAGRCYVSQVAVYASSITAGNAITLTLEWGDGSQVATGDTDAIHAGELSIALDWVTLKRTHSPPSGAKYARMRATKAATAFQFALDRWLFEEDQERDDEPSRVSLIDDFVGPESAPMIGTLPWTLYSENGVIDPGPAQVTKVASTGWTRFGIVSLQVADLGSYPICAYNLATGTDASPMAADIPPVGTSMDWIVRMGTVTTNVRAWCGIWSVETEPVGIDGQSAIDYSQCGVGFIAQGGEWWGVVRVVVAGSHVNREIDMGVSADTNWRRLSWRCVDTGIVFFADGVQVGSAVSLASFGSSTGTFPMFGVKATTVDTPSIEVDKVTLYTLVAR